MSKNLTATAYNESSIRRRSDYIIGFIAPAIGPNKSRKLTRLIASAHNIRVNVWMKKQHTWLLSVCETMHVVFAFKLYRVYCVRRYKPREFLGFVWTDCWGNKSNYVITSPANTNVNYGKKYSAPGTIFRGLLDGYWTNKSNNWQIYSLYLTVANALNIKEV